MIGAKPATTKGITARSANRITWLPGRIKLIKIAIGTSNSAVEMAAG